MDCPKQDDGLDDAQGDLRALVQPLARQAAQEFVASSLIDKNGEENEQTLATPARPWRLLTIPEAAALIRVSVKTIRHWISGEELPAAKLGQQWRMRPQDYAISASNLRTRLGMMALMEAVRDRAFNIVIAEALDRISGDQEDVAAIFKRINHAGVKLITLKEGEINDLHVGLKGTMNALFLKDLADKTRRGQRGRVEVGRIPGGNSHGYKMIRRNSEHGEPIRGEREVLRGAAAIVRRIFDAYVSGQSPRAIAGALNGVARRAAGKGPCNATRGLGIDPALPDGRQTCKSHRERWLQ